MNLYLDANTGVIRDRQNREYTVDQAYQHWSAGDVSYYNLPFQRLIGNQFDLGKTLAYYASRTAKQNRVGI